MNKNSTIHALLSSLVFFYADIAWAQTNSFVVEKPIDLNRGLPAMMDSETMLTKIEVDGAFTNYYLTMVNYPASKLNHVFLSKSQEVIGRKNCSDSDIVVTFENGYAMRYIVFGADNKQVGSFVLSKQYCQRLSNVAE